MIDQIAEAGVKRYIRLPAFSDLHEELSAWFTPSPSAGREGAADEAKAASPSPESPAAPIYATGVCEIPLGVNARRGRRFYSGEIVHGLGQGERVCAGGL